MARIKVGCRNIVLVIILLFVVLPILMQSGKDKSLTGLPTLASLPSLTWTPEVRAIAVETTALPNSTIIPTVVPRQSSSGFITITPAPGTVYPTATVTDTPQSIATNTQPPTPTSVPSSSPTASVRLIDATTYYMTRNANVRSCASSTCTKLGGVNAGTSMTVTGTADGEAVTAGNGVWYQVQYGGQTGYIYSTYLTNVAPVRAQPQQQQPSAQQPAVAVDTGHTALCNDGTYSDSAHRRGTCSHHGGVSQWLKDVPP